MKRMKMAVLLLCVLLAATGCKKKEPKVVIGSGGFEAVSSGNAKEKTEKLPNLFIYRGVMEDTNLMLFQKIGGAAREFAYHYTGGTAMYDRYEQAKALEQLVPGEVYELKIDINTQTVQSMKQSDKVWVFPNLLKYELDLEKGKLQIGDEGYRLGEDVPVFDGDEVYSRDQIGANDELTVVGIGKDILSVIISTEHGELAFKNISGFEKGYFVLGNVAAARITKDELMSVRAGKYLLSVAGSGRGGSEEITVTPGEVTTIDLSKYKGREVKNCTLTLLTEQKNVKVTLNGKKIQVGRAIKLPYGTYQLKATKKGYEDWTKILFVQSEKATIEIDLSDSSGTKNANANNTKPVSGLAGSLAGSVAGSGNGNGSANNSANSKKENTSTTQTTNNSESSGKVSGLVNEVMKILTDSGKSTDKDKDDDSNTSTKENN